MRPPARLVAVLVLLASAACTTASRYAALPKPDPIDSVPTTAPGSQHLDEVVLPAVAGTTSTTIGIGPGPLTIVGRVEDPDGAPVAGAVVHLERLVGDSFASVDVPTAADGTWNVTKALGGRYRIRAWLPPSMAMLQAQIVFIESPASKPVILRLERFQGTRVDAVVAPVPPLIDEEANLKVRVTTRVVDQRGVVRSTPRVSETVALTGSGEWSLRSSNPAVTDSTGSVTFLLVCRDDGPQPLSVVIAGAETIPLSLPDCIDPSATTTSSSSSTTTSTTTE